MGIVKVSGMLIVHVVNINLGDIRTLYMSFAVLS